MAEDDTIKVPARQLFPGPIFPIAIEGIPNIPGMRHDGKRWVDETRSDRPMLMILPQEEPGKDIFGGSGIRKPPRGDLRPSKTRRRGPART